MRKLLFSSFLVFSLGITSLLSTSFAKAEDLDQLKEEKKQEEGKVQSLEGTLEKVQAEKETISSQLEILKKEKQTLENSITSVQEEIQKTEDDILHTEAAIATTEKELQQKKEILAKTLRVLYTKGDVSYMEFLFQSEDISDFLYRFDTLKGVAEANQALYDEVREQMKKLEAEKERLEAQKKRHMEKKQELDGLKKELDRNIQEQTALLEELARQEAEIEKEIQEINSAINAINEQIAAEIKRREEERKKREQENLPPSPDLTGSGFSNPMKSGTYWVSSHYGYRIHPIYGTRTLHGGIDMAADYNTPIYAADNGTVLFSGPASGFGNWIVIDHNNGYLTVYGHMYHNQLYVSPGQQVTKGQHIAGVGSDGGSTGNHLHFEIHQGNLYNRLDPRQFIAF